MEHKSIYEGLFWIVRKIKGHNCKLVEEVNPECNFIMLGCCIKLRRVLRRFTMVSESNPMAKMYFKSTFQIRLESMNHLEDHYYMIHPFSEGIFIWHAFMLAIYSFQLDLVPIFLIYFSKILLIPSTSSYHILMTLNFFCFMDIVISFFCGFFDGRKIYLDRTTVVVHYIKTHFFFDLLSVFQLNYISAYTNWFEEKQLYSLQWIFRFARIGTIWKYSDNYRLRWNLPRYVLKAVIYLNLAVIFLLWMKLLKICLEESDKLGIQVHISAKEGLVHFTEVLQIFFLIEVPLVHKNILGAVFCSILLVVGLFIYIFLTAEVLQFLASKKISRKKYSNLMKQINAYLRSKQVSQHVNNRIKDYVQFKFQKTVFKEKKILDSLSTSLRNEISWHICQNLITKVEIFKNVPPEVMMKMVMLLKHEIYLPMDVVVQTGDIGTEMFFIYIGVLAVFTPTGKEICHLTDGDHFGEIALLLNETRVASCIAIDYCELYRLTKKDFNEALEYYPEAKIKIKNLGEERFREIIELNSQNSGTPLLSEESED